jgi:hypothetical protein
MSTSFRQTQSKPGPHRDCLQHLLGDWFGLRRYSGGNDVVPGFESIVAQGISVVKVQFSVMSHSSVSLGEGVLGGEGQR